MSSERFRVGDDSERVRGRIRREFDNVESVKLRGFQGIDPDDDHFHIQVRREGGGMQSARIDKDDFELIESLLD